MTKDLSTNECRSTKSEWMGIVPHIFPEGSNDDGLPKYRSPLPNISGFLLAPSWLVALESSRFVSSFQFRASFGLGWFVIRHSFVLGSFVIHSRSSSASSVHSILCVRLSLTQPQSDRVRLFAWTARDRLAWPRYGKRFTRLHSPGPPGGRASAGTGNPYHEREEPSLRARAE